MGHCRVVNTSNEWIQIFRDTPLSIAELLPNKRAVDVNVQHIMAGTDKPNKKFVDPVSNIDMTNSVLSDSDKNKFLGFLRTRKMHLPDTITI